MTTQPLYTLGLETSTRVPLAALLLDSERVAETDGGFRTGGTGSAGFPAAIQKMLEDAGVPPGSIGLIAVSIGPGSFTGLRIGTVLAKTWAWTTGCGLRAVSSLEGFARTAVGAGRIPDNARIEVLSDAQRGQFYSAVFEWSAGRLEAVGPVEITGQDRLARVPRGNDWIVMPTNLRLALPEGGRTIRVEPSAFSIGILGREAFSAKGSDDPGSLVPTYIRPSAAEEKSDTPPESGTDGPPLS